MNELPPEVWQCMFQHLLEGVGPQRSLLEALSCAAVCRRWRAMAHAGVGGELDLFPWRKALGDAQVAQVAGRFVHLAALSVSRCPGVTDASLHAIASSECRTSLTRLELLACGQLGSDGAMQQLLTQCTRLRSLTVTNSSLVKSLGLVAAGLPGQPVTCIPPLALQTLKLRSCANVNNSTLALIGHACPDLRELNLTGCRKLLNEGLCRLVGLEDLVPQPTDPSASSSLASAPAGPSTAVAQRSAASAEPAAGCTRLEKLVLRGCYLLTTAGLLRAIPVLLNLASLDIGANRNVDDHTLKGLVPFLPNLTSLSLATCINVTDSGLARVGKLTGLTSLNLRAISAITDHGLPHLMTLSRLSRLVLKFCPRVEGSGFMSWTIGPQLPLEVLDLQGLEHLTDSALETLATSDYAGRLADLDLRSCPLVSNRGLHFITATATNLRTLRLEAQEEIDGDGLALVQRRLGHSLTTLDLERMPGLTDDAVAQLEWPALEILSFQDCAQLSDASVRTVKDRCPRLRLLNLSRCPNITPAQTDELAQRIDTVLR